MIMLLLHLITYILFILNIAMTVILSDNLFVVTILMKLIDRIHKSILQNLWIYLKLCRAYCT